MGIRLVYKYLNMWSQQMSPNIGWQDLKDLFRAAGNVMRADINMDHTTNQSKGTGVVVMESKTEANAAIGMSNPPYVAAEQS